MKKIALFFAYIFISNTYAQDISLELYASGFSSPVNAKHAGDDRLFVVERAGVIKIIEADGSVGSVPFLNIDSRVSNNGGEQGLLALAFHPNYTTNGFFYVNYINNIGDTVISRFTRSSVSLADPNSEVILLTIFQPFSNHNGGDMHFGPNDGYLYISTGDGGSGGDPGNRAQNLGLLLGKILRIDVDGTSNGNYGIPADNPFVSNTAAMDEIWAYGLRNPWKFSFDRSNGDMWIADVGQSTREEINHVSSTSTGGENYGWKCFEGTTTFSSGAGCNTITHQPPVAEYNYGGNPFKCSITGGYRYRGTIQTGLLDLFFFADFCSDEIGVVEEISPNNFNLTFLDRFIGEGFSTFAEDVNGELYAIGLISGSIFRIEDANLSINESTLNDIKMYPNPVNNLLTFDLVNTSNIVSEIRINDVQGKRIQTHTNFQEQLLTISTKSLTSGLYLIEIIDIRGNSNIRKLIVD
ncbi:Por secretion system C-terminal sorting domain-containing protein [Formosa sp. Hel1_31_208]|uniref:PQQ-dependent sugar dehydrogenase n=1 Tax=Formosa sp. Hel1_31_208 TaxID=1798225 RepID=UPI000879C45D|nr:PQQ-dependent sugar dehydrogenase [Formosa sp. Hel1_31_208]SDS54940.1 Por secretion system C-terminal sorting domain-containing protein [Formosa sp. Hel1_31_208]